MMRAQPVKMQPVAAGSVVLLRCTSLEGGANHLCHPPHLQPVASSPVTSCWFQRTLSSGSLCCCRSSWCVLPVDTLCPPSGHCQPVNCESSSGCGFRRLEGYCAHRRYQLKVFLMLCSSPHQEDLQQVPASFCVT